MSQDKKIKLLILVASLGYFVDIFDLVLFNVVKLESFKDIGLTELQIKVAEIDIFNYQMTGMLLGGLLWGILGDKVGRVSALFGSILLYSVANIANAFVHSTEWYSIWTFVAGFGLAGELGAGITLVSESMKREERGIGTLIIVSVGALGAVGASLAGTYLTWKGAYILGGIMGLALLLLRFGTMESIMFKKINQKENISRGNFFMIFRSLKSSWKYIACILIGLPIWYSIGVMINLSNRYGASFGMTDKINVGKSVMFCYIGLSVGDLLSGYLSQLLKSRKKVIGIYLIVLLAVTIFYHLNKSTNPVYYTWMSFAIGMGSGYWALFAINAAEQFGTNIRSTVANTVPNFVRFSVVPITLSFGYLSEKWGLLSSGLFVGIICILIAFVSLLTLKETFSKDLDYVE
ncbi:MAG: MFS transporter [Saprospiraceae bacterium]|nr:MFS transporter [Candidatus Brachybacter algidus]